MKTFNLSIVFFLIVLTGCKKEKIELCESTHCKEYMGVWENLFKSRNGISDTYFKEHITITKTELSNWMDGESFSIYYTVKIDWATIKNHDQFIIKIDSAAPPYPSLTVSRTNYLTESEINQVLDNYAFSSSMTKVNPDSKLKYSSKIKALSALQNIANTKKIKFNGLYYKDQKPVFNVNGHPYLEGIGKLNKHDNSCIYGEIDLITGEGELHKSVCWVD